MEENTNNVNTNEYKTKKVIFRAYQIVWYILGVIEVLLAFRFILLLFAANPENSFVNFIYSISSIFAQPFSSIFNNIVSNSSIFEWSILIGMIVYLIIAYALVKLIQLINPTTPQKVKDTVD